MFLESVEHREWEKLQGLLWYKLFVVFDPTNGHLQPLLMGDEGEGVVCLNVGKFI